MDGTWDLGCKNDDSDHGHVNCDRGDEKTGYGKQESDVED
jgi:hypothetical protein